MGRKFISLTFILSTLALTAVVAGSFTKNLVNTQSAQLTDSTGITGYTTNSTYTTTFNTSTNNVDTYVQDTTYNEVTTTTNTSTTSETTSSTQVSTNTNQNEYIACPFTSTSQRRTVDFTNNATVPTRELVIVANGSINESKREKNVELSSGIYRIELASFSSVLVQETLYAGPSSGQRWHVELIDSSGSAGVISRPTRDTEPGELVIELTDININLPMSISKIIVRHEAYPSTNSLAVIPLCASFIKIGELEPTNAQDADLTSGTTSAQTVRTESETQIHMSCPITERAGRTIVDFTFKGTKSVSELTLLANGKKEDATLTNIYANIPTGVYEVRFASYVTGNKFRTAREMWRATLFNQSDIEFTSTPPAKDVPDWENVYVNKLDSTLLVEQAVKKVGAKHDAFPSPAANSVAPLCVSFEQVGSLSIGNTEPFIDNTIQSSVTVKSPSFEMLRDEYVEERLVGTATVRPADVGISSGLREMILPEQIATIRKLMISTLDDSLFNTLNKLPQRARNELGLKLSNPSGNGGSNDQIVLLTQPIRQERDTSLNIAVSNNNKQDEYATFEKQAMFERILYRQGLVSIRDTDGDGVTDYDEQYLFDTDPENAFSSGSVLTDGERLLLGLDPTTSDFNPIKVESVKTSGLSAPELYEIESIELYSDDYDSTNKTKQGTQVRLTGKAQPLSFVTLYIYSTPIIVTVQADSSGHFEYTLDEILEDGSHEIYVATVDNSGKVLAKSNPIPFVQTAEAIEYLPVEVSIAGPVDDSIRFMFTFIMLVVLLAAVLIIVWLGIHRSGREEEVTLPNNHGA